MNIRMSILVRNDQLYILLHFVMKTFANTPHPKMSCGYLRHHQVYNRLFVFVSVLHYS